MQNKTNPIQVADKLFAVMELLAANGSMGLIEISKSLNLNKTTVHRILNSLIFLGYVMQDEKNGHYRLGYKICRLSQQLLDKVDITKIVRPFLQELVEDVGETAHFVQVEGHEAVYIDKIESTTNTIRLASQLGRQLPLYSSAVGKAILADYDDKTIKNFWDTTEILPITANTITDFNDFMQEINRIRKQGFSLDNEENEVGIRCIATSLGNSSNPSNYAFSVSAPNYRMSNERIAKLEKSILETKKQILCNI